MDQTPKSKLDLTRLRAIAEKPCTKAGQIRQAWPDTKALFNAGHSLKDIWMWLNEIGIEIGYARLSHYTGQLKRRDQTAAPADVVPAFIEHPGISDDTLPGTSEAASREIRTAHEHCSWDGREQSQRDRNTKHRFGEQHHGDDWRCPGVSATDRKCLDLLSRGPGHSGRIGPFHRSDHRSRYLASLTGSSKPDTQKASAIRKIGTGSLWARKSNSRLDKVLPGHLTLHFVRNASLTATPRPPFSSANPPATEPGSSNAPSPTSPIGLRLGSTPSAAS